MKKISFVILLALVMSACQKYSPVVYRGFPREYAFAFEKTYGHFYDSVPYGVVGLDLYSDGLSLDENRHVSGTGYNLCLTDIFVPDSLLETGSYRSDTSAQAFTFLPGRDYEGTPNGIYLLSIEEGQLKAIQVIDSGYIEVKDTTNALIDLQFTLYYRNTYGSRATYKTHFQGAFEPWQK